MSFIKLIDPFRYGEDVIVGSTFCMKNGEGSLNPRLALPGVKATFFSTFGRSLLQIGISN